MASPEAIATLRANLAQDDAGEAFGDADLAAMLDARDGDELLARRDAVARLRMAATREVDHGEGATRESASQWFKHLTEILVGEGGIDEEIARRAEANSVGAGFAPARSTASAVAVGW